MLSFIIAANIMIAKHPITASELSIYSTFSPLIWVLLIAPILIGIAIVIYGTQKKQNIWQIGLLLILCSNIILVLLPYLKGYYFSDGWDNLFHLGYIQDIINTGHFGTNNIYPGVHIFATEISTTLALSPQLVINFIGPFFYILFVLFTYICAKEILPRQAAIFAVTAGTTLSCFFYTELYPFGFTLVLFPFIFFLYFRYLKQNSLHILLSLIILIALVVIFHPVASFLLALALILLEAGKLIFRKFYNNPKEQSFDDLHVKTRINLIFPIISLGLLAVWAWIHPNLWNAAEVNIKNMFNITGISQSFVNIAQENMNKMNLGISGEVLLFIRLYGTTFLYLGLSLIAVVIICKRKIITEYGNQIKMFIYSCTFLPFVVLWLVDYVRPLTTLASGRLIYAATLFFPLLVGLVLYKVGKPLEFNHQKTSALNRIPSIVVLLILAFCSIISILSLYNSPSIYEPFAGITLSYFQGEAWIVQNGNPIMTVLYLNTTSPESVASALWGTTLNLFPTTDPATIPFHFGYTSNETFGQSLTGNTYLFLISSDKLLYTDIWPQVNRLTLSDFTRLDEADNSVDIIYNNGEAQDYFINGSK
jgi:hypothetical protein